MLTESKLLLNNTDIQMYVTNEFQRRFKEEYCSNNINNNVSNIINDDIGNTSMKNIKKSNDFNSTQNIVSSYNNTEIGKKNSFTVEFIQKLISNIIN